MKSAHSLNQGRLFLRSTNGMGAIVAISALQAKFFKSTVKLPGGVGNYALSPGQTTTKLFRVADMDFMPYALGVLKPVLDRRPII